MLKIKEFCRTFCFAFTLGLLVIQKYMSTVK